MKPTHIIVVESGWVFAAELEGEAFEKNGLGVDLHLTTCRCIIQWGTTDGLAELAVNGPTSSTKLGECAVAHIPASRVMYTLRCEPRKWG